MAVLTKTGTKVRSRVEETEEPETKVKPEEAPVVDKGLNRLVLEWEKSFKQTESYWPRIVEYVADNDVSRKTLEKALIDLRGMQPMTAKNEVSKIFKGAKEEHRESLDQVLAGEKTVREFREEITTKQEGTDDAETKFNKKLEGVARYAITEIEMLELSDFIAASRKAYKSAFAKVEKAARKAEGETSGDGEEETTEESED
jgi:hypothetical protein